MNSNTVAQQKPPDNVYNAIIVNSLDETMFEKIDETALKETEDNDKKREREKRYRKQNREKLRQSEVERRKCKQNLRNSAKPSTSPNINRSEIMNAHQKKRERQKRYRERNREKLKKRETERRRSQQNSGFIADTSNIDYENSISEDVISDEISRNSPSAAVLEETKNVLIGTTELNSDIVMESSFNEIKLESEIHFDESLIKTEDCDYICTRDTYSTDNKEIYEDTTIKMEPKNEYSPTESIPNYVTVKNDDCIAENEDMTMKDAIYQASLASQAFYRNKKIHAHTNTDINQLKERKTGQVCRSQKYHLHHIDEKNPDIKTYRCNFCDFISSKTGALKRHINATHKSKSYKCEYCDYKTVEKYRLKSHVEGVHLKVNKFKCHLCEYEAAFKSNLLRHIDCMHLQFKNYSCSFCDYTAKQKNYLTIHVNRVHLNVKNHKCQMCSYSSTRKNDLQRHMDNIHLQLKNQKCPFCEYTTTQKGNIKRHVKRIHPEVEELS